MSGTPDLIDPAECGSHHSLERLPPLTTLALSGGHRLPGTPFPTEAGTYQKRFIPAWDGPFARDSPLHSKPAWRLNARKQVTDPEPRGPVSGNGWRSSPISP